MEVFALPSSLALSSVLVYKDYSLSPLEHATFSQDASITLFPSLTMPTLSKQLTRHYA